MNLKLSSLCLILVAAFSSVVTAQSDVLNFDTSRVLLAPVNPFFPPAEEGRLRLEVHRACKQAEAILEERIIGFSSEMPGAVRNQIRQVQVICEITQIDGLAGGILAQAGPTQVINYDRRLPNNTVANNVGVLTATLQFDLEELAGLSAAGLLDEVALHEGMHAIGFGSYQFTQMSLTGPVGGIGLTQFIGGKYALPTYRQESGNPVASFIPVQQTGAGSAGAHWALNVPVFDQRATNNSHDVMLAFIDLVNPPDVYVSNTTWAVFADVGYAVTGFNGHLVAKPSTGRFPKRLNGDDPFAGNGTAPIITNSQKVSQRSIMVKTGFEPGVKPTKTNNGNRGLRVGKKSRGSTSDPYNLRGHRWNDSAQNGGK